MKAFWAIPLQFIHKRLIYQFPGKYFPLCEAHAKTSAA